MINDETDGNKNIIYQIWFEYLIVKITTAINVSLSYIMGT